MEYIIESFIYAIAVSLIINSFKLMTGDEMILRPLFRVLESVFRSGKLSKWRDERGLLYIAKPIYACVTCMPSVWSSPLLLLLPPLQVLLIALFAVVFSTLIYDKLNP